MHFTFTRNKAPIREIFKKFTDGELIIDDSYQRRRVWTEKDNVGLMETILLNLVIPEIFLWPSEINPENGDAITHIVDGQQRITAISDFISGEYVLRKQYLKSEIIIDSFGNLKFEELPNEVKKDFWSYEFSIVNIDRNCSIEDVKLMFKKLNMTDYRLNEQEIRHSTNSEFGSVSLEISRNEFWDEINVFSSSDVKRMKDVEYCSNILILAEEGIVDQATKKKLNQVYDDYKYEYPNKDFIVKKVIEAINLIRLLVTPDTQQFLSRKLQLYTTFSFIFDLLEENINLDQTTVEKYISFVNCYSTLKNEISENAIPSHIRDLYQMINSYRLASSEGVNKLSNRMLRFEIMRTLCLHEDFSKSKFDELLEHYAE